MKINNLFSNDRITHSVSVGRLMFELALVIEPDNYKSAEEMFLLGYVHDIGYEFVNDNAQHAYVGYEITQLSNYKYANEIREHGNAQSQYSSIELFLLNFADMMTNQKGEYVTFDDRLNDIKNRHGENSVAYQQSQQVISNIKKNKFYDNLINHVTKTHLKI